MLFVGGLFGGEPLKGRTLLGSFKVDLGSVSRTLDH